MAQIEILEPQSRWPAEFAVAGARLRQALGPLALAINDHRRNRRTENDLAGLFACSFAYKICP
jgi:hypothetical protein